MNLYITIAVGVGSAVVMVLAACLVVRALPTNFFLRPEDTSRTWTLGVLLRKATRNVGGIILIVAGLILVLPIFMLPPGSGFVISAVGLLLTDLPGKRWLVSQIVSSPKVFGALNWIRNKLGRKPFLAAEPVVLTNQSALLRVGRLPASGVRSREELLRKSC